MENPEDIMEFLDCTGGKRSFKFEVIEAGPLIRLEAKGNKRRQTTRLLP